MNNRDTVLVMPGIDATNGMPHISKPFNLDDWPSEEATRTAINTIAEIIQRGFAGVQGNVCSMPDGRQVCRFACDVETPEGRMAQGLMAFASVGKSQPVATSLAILERIYREQNLPLPQKQNGPAR